MNEELKSQLVAFVADEIRAAADVQQVLVDKITAPFATGEGRLSRLPLGTMQAIQNFDALNQRMTSLAGMLQQAMNDMSDSGEGGLDEVIDAITLGDLRGRFTRAIGREEGPVPLPSSTEDDDVVF